MGYTDVILSQPPKGNFLKLKEMVGHRLLVLGTHSIEEQPDNMNPGKTRKVATIDVVDFDDTYGGRIQWNALVDKPGVVNKLVGQTTSILGRLILGDAKAGQSAPFILDDHRPEDAAYFTNVWLPANRDALAGKAPQQLTGPTGNPVQAAVPAYAAAAPQAAAPPAAAPQQWAQPAMAPQPQVAQPAMAQPQVQYAQGQWTQPPQAAPAPPPSPEALAALQAMIARGEIQVPAT